MIQFNRFNLSSWGERFVRSIKHFPVTFAYIIIATVSLWISIRGHQIWWLDGEFFMRLWSLMGIVFSYMVHLYAGDKAKGKRRLIVVLSNLFWTAVCVFFLQNYPLSGMLTAACIACCLSIGLGLFILPFYKQEDDRPAISFALGFFMHICLSLLVSCILFLGLELLIQSFDFLFDFRVGDKQFGYVLVFCFVFLAPSLVVLQTPSVDEKYSLRDWMQNKFINGVIHFLLIPLHFVYLATLYLYVIKIVFTWTLPNGWVSWLVAALMLLTIVIVYLLYPLHFQIEKKRFDSLVLRYLPLVVLPLLVLMSIGIIRRFSDYGVSVMRVYLLAFNLWCYAVCICLYIFKARRLWWIAGSFAASLLLLSVLPYNVYTFTRDQLRSDVKNMVMAYGITQLPMSKARFDELVKKLDERQVNLVSSKLRYLSEEFDSLGTSGIVDTKDITIYEYLYMSDTAVITPSIDVKCNSVDAALMIPKGYTSYRIVKYGYGSQFIRCVTKKDTLFVTIPYTLGRKRVEEVIAMPVDTLKKVGENDNPEPVIFYGKNTCFCLTSLESYLRVDDRGVLEGVLFIK